jgi:PLD-like domain
MRYLTENNGLRVRAVTGTRAVCLAFDVDSETRKGLRGFSIRRTEHWKKPGGEEQTSTKWLQVSKVFKSVDPRPKEKVNGRFKIFRSDRHPIQKFFWADYGARPGTDYQYEVYPAYGATAKDVAPTLDRGVTLALRTEVEDDGRHGIWFNRGAIASQHYAREFGNIAPSPEEVLDVTNIKTSWLSRGLLEACLGHIDGTAKGEHLYACLYEFTYRPIIDAFARAAQRGVKVHIIYHATDANRKAIGSALDQAEMIERTRPQIPHNKFIIHAAKDGTTQSVWTGSTNITVSGFLGQSNLGHLFHDAPLAARYKQYWDTLKENPTAAPVKQSTATISPQPDEVVAPHSITPIFCARDDQAMLFWYANRIIDARDLTMFTVAFTVSPLLIPAIAKKRDCLRMLVMESRPPQELAAAFAKGGRDPLLTTSYGAVLGQKKIMVTLPNGKTETQSVDIADFPLAEWFYREEHTRKTGNIFFIHTKYLMIDPLSDDPLICTGSANFSKNSLENNDENMVLIRGDTRVADIFYRIPAA